VQTSTKINKNILAIKSNQIIKIVIKIKRKGDKSEKKKQQVTVKKTAVSKSVVDKRRTTILRATKTKKHPRTKIKYYSRAQSKRNKRKKDQITSNKRHEISSLNQPHQCPGKIKKE
jgi:hypothetical protein